MLTCGVPYNPSFSLWLNGLLSLLARVDRRGSFGVSLIGVIFSELGTFGDTSLGGEGSSGSSFIGLGFFEMRRLPVGVITWYTP